MKQKDGRRNTHISEPENTGTIRSSWQAQRPPDNSGGVGHASSLSYPAYLNRSSIHLLLIVAFTMLAYSNTLYVPFLFDDIREIAGDPALRNLSLFADPSMLGTRYIARLSFALNYALHGLNVVGYHVVNIAIHLAGALLVYWLVILTFSTPAVKDSRMNDSSKMIALFSALFFACHPIQTEAVTYIVQRLASLAALFCLFSISAYAKARLSIQEGRSNMASLSWYAASLLSAVLAMKTKEFSFTLPVLIALYEFMFFRGDIRKRALYLFPMLLTMLIIPLSVLSVSKPLGEVVGDVNKATRMGSDLMRSHYLFTQFSVVTTYVRLLFLPVNQNLNYDYPLMSSFFNTRVLLSFLFLLSIFVIGIYLFFRYRRRAPHATLISFGIFWFFLTLSVESSIIPIADVIFEHRLYLPSVGFFMALVTSVFWLVGRVRTAYPATAKAVLPALAAIVVALTGATLHRNHIWKDGITFWSDVVQKSPNLAGPRNNLGNAFAEIGLTDKAIEQYRIILIRYPNDADAHHNMGVSLASKGMTEKAIEQYQTALRSRPDNYDTHFNLGAAYFSQGLTGKAIEEYQKALASRPGFAEAYVNMGIAYGTKDSMDKAVECFEIALKLDPRLAQAHANLGVAYQKLGSAGRAVEHLQTAVKLRPDYANAHYNLGKLYLEEGSADKALEHLGIAVKLQPEHAGAHYYLGKTYLDAGSTDSAIEQLRAAVGLQPGLAEAHKDFGIALRRKGLIDSAIEQFQTAIKLKPDISEAHRHLADAYSAKHSFDLAIKEYQALARLDPKSAVVCYNLGVNLYNKGLTKQAIDQFGAALRLQPDSAEFHNALGTAYLKSGAVDKAIDHLQAAAKLNPDNPLYRGNLAKVYEMKKSAVAAKTRQ